MRNVHIWSPQGPTFGRSLNFDRARWAGRWSTGMLRISLCGRLTNRLFRGSRHGGPSTEVAERAAIRGRRGMGAECACYAQRGRPRKAAEDRGRPRKAAGRAEPEPRIAPVLCFHGNVEGTTPAGRRYSTPAGAKRYPQYQKRILTVSFRPLAATTSLSLGNNQHSRK